MPDINDYKNSLLQLVRQAVQQDNDLREKYQIGDKFKFIRERLNALLLNVEENLKVLHKDLEKKSDEVLADEVVVFIHLYNAHGIMLPSWQKMLSPSVFYEYSVNRPIYTEKAHIEAFIRSKTNKLQNAFITIAIKKADILPAAHVAIKDPLGNPVVKVKEGSLKFERMFSFTHNNQMYKINPQGALVKKE